MDELKYIKFYGNLIGCAYDFVYSFYCYDVYCFRLCGKVICQHSRDLFFFIKFAYFFYVLF